jgi:hypothetical protein
MTITNEQYHADPAVSASHLHAVARSPYHYWSRYLDLSRKPVEPTAAMRLGSLVHCAVLEPGELSQRYGVCGPRNTKAGKEQAERMAAAGIEAVTASDMMAANCMADSVHRHPAASALLAQGKAEQSFWWDDSATGLRCKCRPDWYYGTTVVDLKTTTDASPSGFARSIATFRYHVQASHYLTGLHGAERFVFIAVEKTAPYAVAVYELDAAALAAGDELRQRDMRVIADCQATKEWPGYGDDCQTLSLPSWALTANPTITSDDF